MYTHTQVASRPFTMVNRFLSFCSCMASETVIQLDASILLFSCLCDEKERERASEEERRKQKTPRVRISSQ